MIGRHLQRFQSRQILLPVPHLLLQHLPLQPLPLPYRVIRILHRQLAQPCRLPRSIGLIQRRKLPLQDPHRPPVTHDVVHVHQQHMLLLPQLQQLHPQQGPSGQIKRLLRLRLHPLPHLFLSPLSARFPPPAQIFFLHPPFLYPANLPHRSSPPHPPRHFVGHPSRLQLFDKPPPLLPLRQSQTLFPPHPRRSSSSIPHS